MSMSKYMKRFQWPIKNTSTPNNAWGSQQTIYLDRHAPDCGIGAISQFHLRRGTPTTIRYDTQCIMPQGCDQKCPAAIKQIDSKECPTHSTPKNILGNWTGLSTNYLDRHHVKCPAGKVLTYFRLRSNWSIRKIWYTYKCCPAETGKCGTYKTPLQIYGNMGNIYLDRQRVKTPNIRTQAMTGFRLLSIYPRRSFQYLVHYCEVTGR